MNNITLNQLIKKLFPQFSPISQGEYAIANLQLDSRHIQVGDLFVGIIGHKVDGRQYAESAIQRGAQALLLETTDLTEHLQITELKQVPVIKIFALTRHLSQLADIFYDSPSQKQLVSAVTGTNGKTTISQLIAQWAHLMGDKTAVLGTLGNGLLHQLVPSENTTGSAIDIQARLADFAAQQVALTAMEVSSHGLVQDRVNHIAFDVVAMTNLSHDHLDYHHTMEEYALAKWRLFADNPTAQRVINIDDAIGYRWAEQLQSAITVSLIYSKAILPQHRHIYASQIVYSSEGSCFNINSSWGSAVVQSPLMGAFNINNLLVALASLLALGYEFEALIAHLNQLKTICGRMERFSAAATPLVLVDYAHSPDALQQALQAARYHCSGQLWCVFGCGGDRDRLKRPKMGQIAEQLADNIVITADNPRTEPSVVIADHILKGLQRPTKANIILNRTEAIKYAIQQAKPEDIILIAGKGHEDYQVIGLEKQPYDERAIVAHLLGELL